MGLINAPNIVRDGLIAVFDGANARSFRGEPTTNLSYNNGQGGSEYLAASIAWTNSGTWTLNTNDTSITKPSILEIPYLPTLPTNLRVISGVTNTVGSQHHGCGWTSVSPSTTYTMTVWFRQNRAGCSSPYLRTNVNNNSLGNFSYNGSTNSANWPVNTWIRISATATTQANENAIYLSDYIGTQVGDATYFYGHQVEAKSYSTPLVAGTRGTTNATGGGWVDLSGNSNHGELVNGPTYTSDNNGSIVFDGSNDYVDITSDLGTMSTYTIMFWARRDAENRMPIAGRTSTAFYWYGDNSWYYTHGGVAAEYYYSKPTSIPLNTWGHYCVVYNGSNVSIYRQGAFQGSQNTTGTANFSQGLRIGYWSSGGSYAWQGRIANVLMYNTSLSGDAVLQNFEATRARFGV